MGIQAWVDALRRLAAGSRGQRRLRRLQLPPRLRCGLRRAGEERVPREVRVLVQSLIGRRSIQRRSLSRCTRPRPRRRIEDPKIRREPDAIVATCLESYACKPPPPIQQLLAYCSTQSSRTLRAAG